MKSAIIGEANTQNYHAYWEAVQDKRPMIGFGGADNELIRFQNVKESPYNGHGFIGREWFKQKTQN